MCLCMYVLDFSYLQKFSMCTKHTCTRICVFGALHCILKYLYFWPFSLPMKMNIVWMNYVDTLHETWTQFLNHKNLCNSCPLVFPECKDYALLNLKSSLSTWISLTTTFVFDSVGPAWSGTSWRPRPRCWRTGAGRKSPSEGCLNITKPGNPFLTTFWINWSRAGSPTPGCSTSVRFC
jgi:hypothetical protein